jgi:hypothetical protein
LKKDGGLRRSLISVELGVLEGITSPLCEGETFDLFPAGGMNSGGSDEEYSSFGLE